MVCVSSILHTTRAEHGVCEFQEQSMVCVSSILHTTRAEHGVCEFQEQIMVCVSSILHTPPSMNTSHTNPSVSHCL